MGLLNSPKGQIKILICPVGEIQIEVSSHKIRRNTKPL